MRVAIIGSGIAGQMLVWHLSAHPKKDKLTRIDWYSAESFSPACTFASTSIVRAAGITKGHSPLGDLLYDSLDSFKAFYQKNHLELLESVKSISHLQFISKQSDQLQKNRERYGGGELSTNLHDEFFGFSEPAYMIYPHKLFQATLKRLKNSQIPFQLFEQTYVTEICEEERDVLIKHSQGQAPYDHVFLATGHDQEDAQIKSLVSGHYIEIPNSILPNELAQESWSYHFDGDISMVHRKEDKHLLISVYNHEGVQYLANAHELSDLYMRAQKIFPLWKWVKLEEQHLKVGVRVKGVKRMPIAKWVTKRTAILNGLYKNGFTFAVKLSQEMVDNFLREKS